MNGISKLDDGTGIVNPNSYMSDAQVRQLGRSDAKGSATNNGGAGGPGAQGAGGGGGLENPINFTAGTGVSIGGGSTFDGSSEGNFSFSIGQDVSTTSTVQFSNVSASSTLHIGPTSFEISQRDDGKGQVNTDWVVLGNIIAENYIVSSSVTHMTTSFASGSNIFGDTLDDKHRFTGSLDVTGSLTIGGVATSATNNYLRKHFVKKASSITGNSTASFTAVTASAPTQFVS